MNQPAMIPSVTKTITPIHQKGLLPRRVSGEKLDGSSPKVDRKEFALIRAASDSDFWPFRS
jgi:hypothetical protein